MHLCRRLAPKQQFEMTASPKIMHCAFLFFIAILFTCTHGADQCDLQGCCWHRLSSVCTLPETLRQSWACCLNLPAFVCLAACSSWDVNCCCQILPSLPSAFTRLSVRPASFLAPQELSVACTRGHAHTPSSLCRDLRPVESGPRPSAPLTLALVPLHVDQSQTDAIMHKIAGIYEVSVPSEFLQGGNQNHFDVPQSAQRYLDGNCGAQLCPILSSFELKKTVHRDVDVKSIEGTAMISGFSASPIHFPYLPDKKTTCIWGQICSRFASLLGISWTPVSLESKSEHFW